MIYLLKFCSLIFQCAGLEAKEILSLEIKCKAASTSRRIHFLWIPDNIMNRLKENIALIHKNIQHRNVLF